MKRCKIFSEKAKNVSKTDKSVCVRVPTLEMVLKIEPSFGNKIWWAVFVNTIWSITCVTLQILRLRQHSCWMLECIIPNFLSEARRNNHFNCTTTPIESSQWSFMASDGSIGPLTAWKQPVYFILKFRSWLSGASNFIILSSYTCFHWPLKLSTNGDCDPIKFVMLHLGSNVIYSLI